MLACQPARSAELETIGLTDTTKVISLDGRARYWIDTAPNAAQLGVQALEARAGDLPWALREPNRQYAIDDQVLWFQFDARIDQADVPWYVEVAASGLDRVAMYYRDAQGRWVAQEAGDTKAVSDWPLPGRFPTFQMSHQSGQPVHYWLRIQHARVTFSAPIAIHHLSDLATSRDREQFFLGIYFGLAVLVTIVAAVSALAWRDPSFATYAVYVAMLGLGQAAYLGTGAQYLWTNWLEWNRISTFVLPALSSAVGLWFVRGVTEPARHSLTLDRVVLTTIVVQLLVTLADALIPATYTYKTISLLVLLTLILVAIMIALVWLRGSDPDIRLIALGFVPVAVFALFPVARGLALVPTSFLTRYGLPIGAALEMPILLYALIVRSSRRREARVRARALASTDPLTGLLHHRILLVRLESALQRARTQNLPCALLGVRLVNLEAIGAAHGREAAERALVLAASRLRSVISDVDVASRVGDQQFALLLEGPINSAQALSCATHAVARGLRDSQVLPGGETLKFQVAVAMLPAAPTSATETLKWVMAAVNEIPADARKSIRALNFDLP